MRDQEIQSLNGRLPDNLVEYLGSVDQHYCVCTLYVMYMYLYIPCPEIAGRASSGRIMVITCKYTYYVIVIYYVHTSLLSFRN